MNPKPASSFFPIRINISFWGKLRIHGILIFVLLFTQYNGLSQPTGYNYSLRKCDYYIVPSTWALGIALKYGIPTRNLLTKEEISALKMEPTFPFDHFASGKYNTTIDKAGDVMIGVSIGAPLLLSIPSINKKNWQQVATINIMYAEVLGITFAMAELNKVVVNRIRPYMYNTDLTVEERYWLNSSGDSEKSFYSMHTAFAFSSAVFLSKVYSDSFGKSTQSRFIWAGSLGIAATIGISRVYSGQHFPTDVIMGALIGGCTGYLVPVMYKTKQTRTALIITPNAFQVSIRI